MVFTPLPVRVTQGAQAFCQSAQAFGRATDAYRIAVDAAAAYRVTSRRFAAGSGGLVVSSLGLGAALAVGTHLLNADVEECIEDSGTYSAETHAAIEQLLAAVLAADVSDCGAVGSPAMTIVLCEVLQARLVHSEAMIGRELNESDRRELHVTFELARSLKHLLENPIVGGDGPSAASAEALSLARPAAFDPADAALDLAFAEAAVSVGRDRLAAATDQVFSDTAALREVVTSRPNSQVCHVKGLTAEGLLAGDFNREAARRVSPLRAEWTHLTDPHAPADIRVTRAGVVLREAQVKSDQNKYTAYRKQRDAKYTGMARIVTTEQLDDVRHLAETRGLETAAQRDVLDHLADELIYEDISSGSISNRRAEEAAKHPTAVTNGLRANECAREIGGATAKGAAAGAATATLVTGVANVREVRRGDLTALEALVQTAKSAAKAGARSGVTTAVSAAISVTARRAGAQRFASGGGPTAVAACALEVGEIVRQCLQGDIDTAQMQREIYETSARAGAFYYGGIVGQRAIPVPVAGAVIGSVIASVITETALAVGNTDRQDHNRLQCRASVTADLRARQRDETDQAVAARISQDRTTPTAIADLRNALGNDPDIALTMLSELRRRTGGPSLLSAEAFDEALKEGILGL